MQSMKMKQGQMESAALLVKQRKSLHLALISCRLGKGAERSRVASGCLILIESREGCNVQAPDCTPGVPALVRAGAAATRDSQHPPLTYLSFVSSNSKSITAEAKREDNVKQKKVAALRKALSMYSGRLGLEFKQGAGESAHDPFFLTHPHPDTRLEHHHGHELLLEMTQVQASHPQRVFKVAVRVLPDNSYSGKLTWADRQCLNDVNSSCLRLCCNCLDRSPWNLWLTGA
eukprot:1159492-Pelagomonas_calceolata.AAC.1